MYVCNKIIIDPLMVAIMKEAKKSLQTARDTSYQAPHKISISFCNQRSGVTNAPTKRKRRRRAFQRALGDEKRCRRD
jgi:hypothetical protein